MHTLNEKFIRVFLRQVFADDVLPHRIRSMLDLGCGSLPYRALYSGRVDFAVTADYEVRAQGVQVRVDAHKLPFAAESFSLVLCSEVIEHLRDPVTVFRELHRIIEPGGYLILTWPFLHSMHEVPNDYIRFTEFGMQQLLLRNDFALIKLQRRGDLLGVIWQFLFNAFSAVAALLLRVPIFGLLVRPVWAICRLLISGIEHAYVWAVKDQSRVNPRDVGSSLNGPWNHLGHSSLGYCLLARRK